MVLREREIVLNQNQLKLDQQKFDAGEEERWQFYFCTSANRTNLSALCVYVCACVRMCQLVWLLGISARCDQVCKLVGLTLRQ